MICAKTILLAFVAISISLMTVAQAAQPTISQNAAVRRHAWMMENRRMRRSIAVAQGKMIPQRRQTAEQIAQAAALKQWDDDFHAKNAEWQQAAVAALEKGQIPPTLDEYWQGKSGSSSSSSADSSSSSSSDSPAPAQQEQKQSTNNNDSNNNDSNNNDASSQDSSEDCSDQEEEAPASTTTGEASSSAKGVAAAAATGSKDQATNGNGNNNNNNNNSDSSSSGNPNKNPACGHKIADTYGGKTITVSVADRCVGCAWGDLDFTSTGFSQLADMSQGRLDGLSWSWIGGAP
ncbi:hypothetical protein NDA13_003602 [Ustilago tritici]|nr:hypothetical protein NDA13_003602 [Ustilago tritici]